MPRERQKRRICFVTGTRAEFGLMRTVLEAIRDHPKLQLQLVVTGMHLHSAHGKSLDSIRAQGWKVDAVVPWKLTGHDPSLLAEQTGLAMARLARVFQRLGSDIVLVTGDRVEVLAAASAAHVGQRIVAHVHGGDRAPGQIDDSLRHAITKLAHVHFPATANSERRVIRLGEDRDRIHRVGSPGIEGIAEAAAPRALLLQTFPKLQPRRFALIVFHPMAASAKVEYARAQAVLSALKTAGIQQTVVVYPNNDPGSSGIIRCWRANRRDIAYLLPDVPRPIFLGLLRDAAMLVGNSSSGIIEAASFSTPVINIGPRQQGRDRSQNVLDVPYSPAEIASAAKRIWNTGRPRCLMVRNVYGGEGTGQRVASILASLEIDNRFRRKLIAY